MYIVSHVPKIISAQNALLLANLNCVNVVLYVMLFVIFTKKNPVPSLHPLRVQRISKSQRMHFIKHFYYADYANQKYLETLSSSKKCFLFPKQNRNVWTRYLRLYLSRDNPLIIFLSQILILLWLAKVLFISLIHEQSLP